MPGDAHLRNRRLNTFLAMKRVKVFDIARHERQVVN